MSTSYYVYCKTCKVAVTDQNECDNHPEIPVCIVKNIISYTHLALFLAELPVPRTSWLDYEVRLSGYRLDLDDVRKHCTHQLAVFDEYGYEHGAPCPYCGRSYCSNLDYLGAPREVGHRKDSCCEKCTTHPVET